METEGFTKPNYVFSLKFILMSLAGPREQFGIMRTGIMENILA